MKKCFKYLFTLILLIMFIAQNKVFAENSEREYTIEGYDINITVNENNTFEITERIIAYFNVPKHGIFRKIPLKNSIVRNDGTKSSNRAEVSNISVNEDCAISKQNGYEVIKIGSNSHTLTGRHSYVIKYTYNIGKDPLKNADEFYFNLIGNEWDTTISNVKFKITMPKLFDKSLLGFSSGYTGSTNSSNVSYSVDGNIIIGSLEKMLYPNEALTVRLTLPEGYFIGASSKIDIYNIVVIAICLICVIMAYRLWVKYGKDNKVIETVEFYPPEGYNSAEIGFLFNGKVQDKSIISLLVYLANKGYIKIEEIEGKGLFNKGKDFKITKIKEYDGNNKSEKLFFKGLFLNSKNKTSVLMSNLHNKFFKVINRVENEIENKYKNIIYEKERKEEMVLSFTFIILFFVAIKIIIEYLGANNINLLILIPIIVLLVMGDIFVTLMISSISIPEDPMPFWAFIIAVSIIVVPMYMFTISSYTEGYIAFERLIDLNAAIISITIIQIFGKLMKKRTSYGTEILGKIKGFKRFLETAEKPQLESLVAENPEYFYNILPYTYALGVSDVWINQFEAIAIQAPEWYASKDTFNMHTFGKFMRKTMKSASVSMSSSTSSGSGGSFGGGHSGGGRSGRGSGGGGGGSW